VFAGILGVTDQKRRGLFCGVAVIGSDHVGIGVEEESDVGVTDPLADHFRVDPGFKRPGGRRVLLETGRPLSRLRIMTALMAGRLQRSRLYRELHGSAGLPGSRINEKRRVLPLSRRICCGRIHAVVPVVQRRLPHITARSEPQ
jgi:hypothetical protein